MMTSSERFGVVAAALALLLSAPFPVQAQTAGWPRLIQRQIASGLTQPTSITHASDGSGRLFATEKAGTARIVSQGALLPAPFLDISAKVRSTGEGGLLGLAFPPGHAQSGRFYVYYTNLSGDIVASLFQVGPDPNVADPASEIPLLTIPHREFPNHYGGQLAFGPDGFLYLGTGDGGGAGDTLGNGQNLGSPLGKLLRLDVESAPGAATIPADNPFAATPNARPEIWAYGLRNPWRFSFDRASGDLWIGDVGQNRWEEIDLQPAGSPGGANYGWNVLEGGACFSPPSACIPPAGYVPPLAVYGHDSGRCSITGGYVYRGAGSSILQGVYVYADFCSGEIFGLRRSSSGVETAVLLIAGYQVSAFGEDEQGELYVADYSSGALYALSAPSAALAPTSLILLR